MCKVAVGHPLGAGMCEEAFLSLAAPHKPKQHFGDDPNQQLSPFSDSDLHS